MQTKLTIENLGDFTAWLTRMGQAAQGQKLEDAAFVGASEIEIRVKEKITGIHLIDTGNLKNSVQARRAGYTETTAEATTGTPVPYAQIHEFGGVIKQTNAWGKGINQTITMPARPYMRPAVDENVDKITDRVGQVIVKNLQDANG